MTRWKRFFLTLFMSWLVFIMIDFVMHASLFANLWLEDLVALKSLTNLAVLIPAGYTSFLLLTALVGWIFIQVHPQKPAIKLALGFGLIVSGLFSLSNFWGMYSYINLPLKQLLVINLTYFIEILAVIMIFYYMYYDVKATRKTVYISLVFLGGLIAGVIIQNLMNVYHVS